MYQWVVFDTAPETKVTLDNGHSVFQVHSFLFVEGNNQDGPLRSEYIRNTNLISWIQDGLGLRILDLGIAKSNTPINIKDGRKAFKVGTTTLRNVGLFNSATRTGLLVDAFGEDTEYLHGLSNAGKVKDCNTFIKRVLVRLGLVMPDEANTLIDGSNEWFTRPGSREVTVDLNRIISTTINTRLNKLVDTIWEYPTDCVVTKVKRDASCAILTQEGDPVTGDQTFKNEISLDPEFQDLPADVIDLDPNFDLSAEPVKAGASLVPDVQAESTLARSGGILKSFAAIDKASLKAIAGGAGMTFLGAAFLIIDFVDHDWVGGAIGAVGAVAGIAASIVAVGWIVDAAIALFFSILPGLFEHQNEPAATTNIQGVLQWTMFGDATHTGNEQCQQGANGIPGNPNCTALYGSGTLATVLNLNNFDTIAYLIQYNQGYPMSITDMAKTWYVVDPNTPGDGDDKIATINCNNVQGCRVYNPKGGCLDGEDQALCNHPTYSINRALITLPVLNETADKIYNRIIPAPNGDCILVAWPGTSYFADFYLNVTGLPSAIACGITPGINVDGTVIPLNATSANGLASTGSPGYQSTDGQGGNYVAPPPQTPFLALNSTDSACLSYQGASLCLPPGTYQKQSGLGFEIGKVDTLTLPPGWMLQTYIEEPPLPRDPRPPNHYIQTWTTNQSPPSNNAFYGFAADMQLVDENTGGQATFTISALNGSTGVTPVCCLFSSVSLGGNVWCAGVGGGSLPGQWEDQAESVICLNGAQVYMFAAYYADGGEGLVSGEADTLKDKPYGTSGTFFQNVKAVWIDKQA